MDYHLPQQAARLNRLLRLAAAGAAWIGIALIMYQLWNISGGDGRLDRAGEPIGQDFLAFYTGWSLALNSPEDLYDLHAQQQFQRVFLGRPDFEGIYAFINPPAYALLFAPLGAIPYRLAYLVWIGLGGAAYVWAIILLRPILPRLAAYAWLPAIAFPLAFPPFYDVISDGQNSFFSLLLAVLILRALLGGRDGLAGLLIGVGMLKPQLFLPLLPLVLITGRWRALVGFALAAALQLLLALAFVGSDGLAQFQAVLSGPLAGEFAAHAQKKYSWDAFFTLIFGRPDGPARIATLFTCGLTFLGLVFVWWRGRDLRLAMAATLFCTLLLIPYGSAYSYDLVLLIPAALIATDVMLHACKQGKGGAQEGFTLPEPRPSPASRWKHFAPSSGDPVSIWLVRGLALSITLIYLLTYNDALALTLGWQPLVLLMASAGACCGILALAPLRAPSHE